MLAHNASVLGVPFDYDRLTAAALEDEYVRSLHLIVKRVRESRELADAEARAAANRIRA